MRVRSTAFIVLLLAPGIVPGCSPSLWESEFKSNGAPAPPLARDAAVRLREVPWERLQGALGELRAQVASSDVHPDDWSPAQRADAHARLLRGLQITSDPAAVQVLGRSEFRTTSRVRPSDPQLEQFARRVGATTVIWTSTYTGKADSIEQEPVNEWRTGTITDRLNRERRADAFYSDNATIWIPVVVQKDEYAWMAYFLRER
ncbi:MAG: hypothetical protein JNM07_10440 [Phycisphaerae bacterium]|nr:hypothetical protein [Phycisphaerae bacterium]